ncbi:MAG TPA: hypothetical protein HPP94_06265 [Desulfuromonadales bacterium]|nr:hypothetical protein [Desulfuromonadales bacterium]
MTNVSPDILAHSIFALNILLVLVDASVGYHLAPRLLRQPDAEEPELRETAIRTVRRMLTVMVSLYMFFNCLGYFNGNRELLLVVTALVACDLGGQLFLGRRSRQGGGQE